MPGILGLNQTLGELGIGIQGAAEQQAARTKIATIQAKQADKNALLNIGGRLASAAALTSGDVSAAKTAGTPMSAGQIASTFGQNLVNPYAKYAHLSRALGHDAPAGDGVHVGNADLVGGLTKAYLTPVETDADITTTAQPD